MNTVKQFTKMAILLLKFADTALRAAVAAAGSRPTGWSAVPGMLAGVVCAGGSILSNQRFQQVRAELKFEFGTFPTAGCRQPAAAVAGGSGSSRGRCQRRLKGGGRKVGCQRFQWVRAEPKIRSRSFAASSSGQPRLTATTVRGAKRRAGMRRGEVARRLSGANFSGRVGS